MKKHWITGFLAVVLAAGLLTGCGGTKGDQAPAGNDTKAQTEQSDSASGGPVLLDSSRDTFQLPMLAGQLGMPEGGVMELLGEGDESGDGYQTYTGRTLFGRTVDYTIFFENGSASSIEVLFTDLETIPSNLPDAITEALEVEPTEDNQWGLDSGTGTLTEENGSVIIRFEPFGA